MPSYDSSRYQKWALSVEGVGAARVFPLAYGINTVAVIIIGKYGEPAAESLVKAVQDYIDPGSAGMGRGRAPIGTQCFVSAAIPKPISLSLIVSKLPRDDEEMVTLAIRNAVENYLDAIALTGNDVSYSGVLSAILSSDKSFVLSQLRLNDGIADIPVGGKECAILRKLEIVYV